MKLFAAGLFLFAVTASAQRATITVDATHAIAPVNPLIFGHNLEAADNARIFTSDKTSMDGIQTGGGFWDPNAMKPVAAVVEQCKAVHMGMLRYPGGCLAHNYDWRKSVGPESKKNGWLFGLDEYLQFCKTVDATPMITVSDYVLPAAEMPENAAALVEYLNSPADVAHPWAMKRAQWGHAAPYGVVWFELGNETVHGNHRVIPHRQYTPEEYADYANATAAAMKKIDPNIKLGIVMVPSAGTDVENNWNRNVVHLAGKSADFVVVHLYAPHAGRGDGTPAQLMQSTMAVGEQSAHHLQEFHTMIARENGKDLPIAVTEYNGSLGETDKPYRFSYGEALESADMLRVYLDPAYKVVTANYWQFLNGYFGMLRAPQRDNTGDANKDMPAMPLYRLWGEHFGTQLLTVDVQAPHADFVGVGSVQPARGTQYIERGVVKQIAIDESGFKSAPGIAVSGTLKSMTIELKDVAKNEYPVLANFDVLPKSGDDAVEYEVKYEARYMPAGSKKDPATDVHLGFGLGDSRGFAATHSGMGADGIGLQWRTQSGSYRPLPDTKGITLTARVEASKANLTGRIEVRNLTVTAYRPTVYPAYSLMTSASSLSADGRTLYVLVFNKSANNVMDAQVALNGFKAKKARLWEVNGETLLQFDGVKQTQTNAPLEQQGGLWVHAFPAHSMTAIEFTR